MYLSIELTIFTFTMESKIVYHFASYDGIHFESRQ